MQNDLSENDLQLEAALRSLQPALDRGPDPVAAAYEAGRRRGRRSRTGWQAMTAVLAVGLASAIWYQPQSPRPSQVRIERQIVHLPDDLRIGSHAPQPPLAAARYPSAPRVAPGVDYLALRDAVLEHGLSALPQPAVAGSRSLRPIPSVGNWRMVERQAFREGDRL